MREKANKPKRTPSKTNLDARKRVLLAAADAIGDADGLVTREELRELHEAMVTHPTPAFDVDASSREEALRALLAQSGEVHETLDPMVRKLPPALRSLALRVDAYWGNADGRLSWEELERVAQYYLAALRFFAEEAGTLVSLAKELAWLEGSAFASERVTGDFPIFQLEEALKDLDEDDILEARPFRELFAEAMKSDVLGAPEMLRDVATHSPRWHSLSILEHTAVTVQAVRELCTAVGLSWKEAGATMLLHDVGKILTRQLKEEGTRARYRFWEHEELGARWLEERGVSKEIVFQIRYHSVLREQSEEELLCLVQHDPGRLARLIVVYVADQLGKGTQPDQLASFQRLQGKILRLSAIAGIDGLRLLARAEELRCRWFAG